MTRSTILRYWRRISLRVICFICIWICLSANVLSPLLDCAGAKKRIFEWIVPASKFRRGEEANIYISSPQLKISTLDLRYIKNVIDQSQEDTDSPAILYAGTHWPASDHLRGGAQYPSFRWSHSSVYGYHATSSIRTASWHCLHCLQIAQSPWVSDLYFQ